MKRKSIIAAIFIIFFIKLFIVSGQIINIKGFSHDDGLFVLSANNILSNNWLGDYNDKTLSKGVAGILFIAISNKLNISYLSAEQILYFLACIAIIIMIRNIINNKNILFIIFTILLMNPISYSDAFSFVYRDGLYTCLILFLLAFSFQIFFNYKSDIKNFALYSFLFGASYSLIYICREETVSLTPYLLCAGIIILGFIIFDKDCDNKIHKVIFVLGIPSIILTLTICAVSAVNYKYYGRFITNDFTSRDFKDVYGALTRIKQKNYIKRVPLNKESREELYKISPTFKELEPFLEGEGKKYFNKPIDDYQEGFLYWAVREAAYKLGYYKDAQTSKNFYNKLSNEINNLCDKKMIECTKKRSSLIAPIYPETIEELKIYIPKTFYYQITYKRVLVEITQRNTDPRMYLKITNNKIRYENKYKLYIMKGILQIYKILNPVVMIISTVFFLFIMIKVIKDKNFLKNYYKQIILLNGIFGLYILRIGTVAFVGAAEYTTALDKCQYLAPTYPVQSLFSILSIIFFIQLIKDNKKGCKN